MTTLYRPLLQSSPLLTTLILTWTWIKHCDIWLPNFFYHGILQKET